MSKNKSEKGAHGGGHDRPSFMFGKGFKKEKDALEKDKKKPGKSRDNKSKKDNNEGSGHIKK